MKLINIRNIILFLAIVILTGCSQEEEKIVKEEAKVVKIFDLQKGTTTQEVFEYPAQIEAFQDTVMAFEVSGKIIEFYFSEGDRVKKGETIAKLDDVIYKADFDSAKANFEQAKKDFKRYEKLLQSKSVSQASFDKYQQNLDVSRAAFQVAKKNFDETRLKAEFDGVLAKKLVDDFARVTAKQAVVRLQDTSSYKIKFFVPEVDMLKTKGDITLRHIEKLVDLYVFIGDDKNNKFQANLLDISTTADKITRTFETTLLMKKRDNMTILPGMTAKVQVHLKKENNQNLMIPYRAVFTDETQNTFVWTIKDNNRVYKQQIQLGKLTDEFVEAISGLDKTSKIVTSGIRFLQSNDQIKEYEKIGE